jgi:hypothetical protein
MVGMRHISTSVCFQWSRRASRLAQRLPHDAVRRRHAHDPIRLRSVAPCKGGGRLIRHARYVIWQLAESPLDGDSLSADSRAAHQPTHVVADLIEPPHRQVESDEGRRKGRGPLKSTVGDLREKREVAGGDASRRWTSLNVSDPVNRLTDRDSGLDRGWE